MTERELLTASDIEVYVSKSHRFGTDAVLLAEFALPRVQGGGKPRGGKPRGGTPRGTPRKVVCDLCAGCGVVGFMLARCAKTLFSAEIDSEAAELATETVRHNALTNTYVKNGDIRDREFLRSFTTAKVSGKHGGIADIVTANPPYYKAGSGYAPAEAARDTARHDSSCTLKDVTAAAAFLLKYGGVLCICIVPDRLTDAFCEMRSAGIEPKRLMFTERNWLCLIEGKKGGKPGLTVQ